MAKTEAEYLEKLINFPTVTGEYEASIACAKYCDEFFRENNLDTKIIEFNKFPNVIATSQNTKKPKVLLQAHLDVVPGKDELFAMYKMDGKLMGRGVFDMKFACASFMKVVSDIADEASLYDFGIMLTFDEEIGGKNGVEALLKEGYSSEVCILPDGGRDWNIETSSNGAWFLRVISEGHSAHGSLPEEGSNAAMALVSFAQSICSSPLNDSENATISLTKINAGKAMNQIPNFAEAMFDIRFKNKEIYQKIKKLIEGEANKHNVNIETIMYSSALICNREGEAYKLFCRIANNVLGFKLDEVHSRGSSDARFFLKNNIPCLILRPPGGGAHSGKEWVSEKDLSLFSEIIYKFIKKYAKI